MSNQIAGQLYRVFVLVRSESRRERGEVEYICVGASEDDVRDRFKWIADLSDWDGFEIRAVAKEPQRSVMLRMRSTKTPESQPDAVIERDGGSEAVYQNSLTTPIPGKKYRVSGVTTCFARSEGVARRKLAERILEGSDHVTIEAEEVSAGSGFAMPKDTSVFRRASFVRG